MKAGTAVFGYAIISVVILAVISPRNGISAMINIPGTAVSIEPPAGFVPASRFSGFIYPEDSSSIEITELPGEAFAEVESIFADVQAARDAFSAEGVGVSGLININVEGRQVPVVTGMQVLDGGRLTKYICLFKGERTVLLFVNIFDSARFNEETVLNSLKSVRLTASPSITEKVAELPFLFNLSGPFRVNEVLSGNTVLLTTVSEMDPAGQLPVVVIGTSLLQIPATDAAELSIRLLSGLEDLGPPEIKSQGPAEFADGDGYFAQAVYQGITVLQFVRILPDNFYIRLLAKGETEMLGSSMLDVMEIAQSVRLRDSMQ